jgi:tellurite resistance protein
MAHHPTPLQFLGPGWFSVVMGLCGLSLAWFRATSLLGEAAQGVAWAIGLVAGACAVVLALASLVRWQRYPRAWAEDLNHPVRHVFVAAMPISLILLATVITTLMLSLIHI